MNLILPWHFGQAWVNLIYFFESAGTRCGWVLDFQAPGWRNQVNEVLLLPKATGGIAVIVVIADHLLPLVWDMQCHGCKPIEGIKDLLTFVGCHEPSASNRGW